MLLGLSVVVWLSIIAVTGQLLFGAAMLAAGISFVPADTLALIASQRAKPSRALPAAAM